MNNPTTPLENTMDSSNCEPTTQQIQERHDKQDKYKGWSPCSDCHQDRGILLKRIGELEDQVTEIPTICRRYERQLAKVIEMLEIAQCPNKGCDGNGVIFLGGDGSNIEPCQWCYERKTIKGADECC